MESAVGLGLSECPWQWGGGIRISLTDETDGGAVNRRSGAIVTDYGGVVLIRCRPKPMMRLCIGNDAFWENRAEVVQQQKWKHLNRVSFFIVIVINFCSFNLLTVKKIQRFVLIVGLNSSIKLTMKRPISWLSQTTSEWWTKPTEPKSVWRTSSIYTVYIHGSVFVYTFRRTVHLNIIFNPY